MLPAVLLVLTVSMEGRPLPGVLVRYSGAASRARTDSKGVARFRVASAPNAVPPPYTFDITSRDLVLVNLRGRGLRWQADAVHSARWRQRTDPRPCDEWRRTLDITRGNLYHTTAQEYDEWYASLTPNEVAGCETLTKIEREAGSKAPWYFYAFKSRPRACVDGKYGNEEDWALWYRGLLAKATKASPGKCVEDWERWWRAKGYTPIPEPPAQ